MYDAGLRLYADPGGAPMAEGSAPQPRPKPPDTEVPHARSRLLDRLNKWQTLLAAVITTAGAIVIAIWLSGVGVGGGGSTGLSAPISSNSSASGVNVRATVPSNYFGVWKGSVSQTLVPSYPITLTIHGGKGGSIVGTSFIQLSLATAI